MTQVGDHIVPEWHPAEHRKHSQPEGEDVDQHDSEEEVRHRESDPRNRAGQAIAASTLTRRGPHSERYGHDGGQ